jgi:methionyl-tRNA formyltransferase
MTRLKLAYMGTPDFAVPGLAALIETGHEIAAVYSQPPRRAGRGQKERPSPVHAFANEHGLPVRTPSTLRDEVAHAEFAAFGLDAAIVVAYGLILPLPVLAAPRLGCINVHASLLPRWRGAAPIQRAILAGDTETGISIMMMEEGLDTGPVLRSESLPIGLETTAGGLHDALAALGGRMIAPVIADFNSGHIVPEPQNKVGTTYARKLEKSEARINWAEEASMVVRRIHAFAPWPGAWFMLGGERVKVLAAQIETGYGAPREVLDDALRVACGSGAVRLHRLQREGKKPSAAEDFLRGRPVATGTVLE